MDTKTIIHIIRNPHGHSEDEVREARQKAADLIEKLERVNASWLQYASEHNIPCTEAG